MSSSGAEGDFRAQRDARQEADAAARFVEDPEMERALELRDKHPAEYDKLSGEVKIQLGFYQREKAAAGRGQR